MSGLPVRRKEFLQRPIDQDTTCQPSAGTDEQYGKFADRKFDCYGIVGGGGVEIRAGIGHFLLSPLLFRSERFLQQQ